MINKLAVAKIGEYCLGKKVLVWSVNFSYWGVLDDLDEGALVLTGAHVVFETGPLDGPIEDKNPIKSGMVIIPIGAIEAVSPWEE